jgi:hypothetical protein
MEFSASQIIWSVFIFVGGIIGKHYFESHFKKTENRDKKDAELDNKFNELEKHMAKGFSDIKLSMEKMLSSIEKLALSQSIEGEKRQTIKKSLDTFKERYYAEMEAMKKEIAELKIEIELLKNK